jgi:hypothetical protein
MRNYKTIEIPQKEIIEEPGVPNEREGFKSFLERVTIMQQLAKKK